MSKISFVVPAFNEAESLPHVWEQLRPVAVQFDDWEVIIINDGSTDGTAAWVTGLQLQDHRVRLAGWRRNRGKSAALMAGFAIAAGDIIVTLDADLQDDPAEIPNMVKTLEQANVDLVGGWKQQRYDPFIKRISSKVFNRIASRIVGQRFHDLNCGLKVYRREVTQTLDLYGDLYRFIPVLAAANGWKVAEVPVIHHPRKWGVSKYGLRLAGVFDLMSLALITKYRWKPLHFFGRWGLILFLIGVVMLAWLVVEKIGGAAIGDRPLLIFGVLCVVSGLQLFFTGLLGDLILQNSRRR